MTIVIPLGKGSPYENQELRYSLRSVEKFVPHEEIVIVGELPEWCKNILHIPCDDEPNGFDNRKQGNIRRKILKACADERVSDPFLFCNDDYFFLRRFEEIKYWYKGTVDKVRERGARPLEKELAAMGLENKNYDIHVPILYEKGKFTEANSKFSKECIIKSSYCNYWKVGGEEWDFDLKINLPMPEWNIWSLIEERRMFSTGDEGFSPNMIRVLNTLFPEKSKYEL